MEELKWLGQFGLGAVMAGLMFHFYRVDRKASEERTLKLAEEFRTLAQEFRQIVKDNTEAVTNNTSAVRSLHDRLIGRNPGSG